SLRRLHAKREYTRGASRAYAGTYAAGGGDQRQGEARNEHRTEAPTAAWARSRTQASNRRARLHDSSSADGALGVISSGTSRWCARGGGRGHAPGATLPFRRGRVS